MQYSYDMTAEHCRRTTVSTANGTPTPENSAVVEYAYSAEPAGDGLVYAVTRTISYNRYGEAETDALSIGSMTHTVTERRDAQGRSTGYIYAKNDIPQQQTSIGYGADGRIATAGFTHQGEHKEFIYSYLPGTHLLHTLTHPNGLTLTQSYDNDRDLPTQMAYSRADALVVQRAYTYDILGRPTARNLARYGTETQDTFGYNTRSELTSAHVNSADYSYTYDAIGNRTVATEAGTRTAYTANKLNQYTAEGAFKPTFDADGNQTLIKTSTGIWNVTYNAKNRPVRFEKTDSSIVVECTYDTMGRRATKKVTTNGTLTEYRRFLYRGYLQIACCDLTRAYTPALWFITWDPTQPTATRPLAIQKNGTWYTYGWDLTKNICETYRTDARIDLAYTYSPYGEVSPAHAYDQPIRWSSEYHDVELGLVYYNYRHYNPAMGRWMGRDLLPFSNLYIFVNNYPISNHDFIGLIFNEKNIATASIHMQWWDDDGGPAGQNGTLDIGQQDNWLSTVDATYSASCACGMIQPVSSSRTNEFANGIITNSFWWGKSITSVGVKETFLGPERLDVTFYSRITTESELQGLRNFLSVLGAGGAAFLMSAYARNFITSQLAKLAASGVITVGTLTSLGVALEASIAAIIPIAIVAGASLTFEKLNQGPEIWYITASMSCNPANKKEHKPTIQWGTAQPSDIHIRATSSRVYSKGHVLYVPLHTLILSSK